MPSHASIHLHLQLGLVILLSLTLPSQCSYSKVQFLTLYTEITSIINCRASSNVIFTDGQSIKYWVSYQKMQTELLPYISKSHQISCSKYGTKLDHSYVVLLDDQGRVTLWEQVASTFNVAIYSVPFAGQRAKVGDASIGNQYLALAYFNERAVDIFDLKNNNQVFLYKITFTSDIRTMKLDSLGNLVTICQQNNTLKFIFHRALSLVRQQINLPITNLTQKITIDYEQPQEGDTFLMRYLISTYSQSGTIQLMQNQLLSLYVPQGMYHRLEQLCDHQLTYVTTSTPTIIEKETDGPLFSLDHPILMYTCATDTGVYLYSEMFAVSQQNGVYYIDCYYDVNAVLDFLIGFGLICCCVCVRLCPAFCSGNACRDLGGCLALVYYIFCWCPTRDSMEEIEDKIQR